MAYEDRSYSGNAVSTTLTSSISNTATTIPIAASTGWPDGTSGPFHVGIAPADNPDNYIEVIRCSGRVGLNLSVQTVPVNGRGWDNTTPSSHLAGAVIRHVVTATDLEEANQHIVNTSLDNHSQYLTVNRHDSSARHGFGVLPTTGIPSTSLVGDTASSGTSNNVARVDHKHAREGFGSPVTAGPVNANGSAITVARSDHVHAGGIPIIANEAARPASPVDGQTVIEADVNRMVQFNGTSWRRGPHFTAGGRTGIYGGRGSPYTIPDAGASSYIIPWDTKIFDSDSLMPPPDGTTTYTITIPTSGAADGLYFASLNAIWASVLSARAYIEIIHSDGAGLFQYRVSTTGEDRGCVGVLLDLSPSHTVQIGAWQNSGVSVGIAAYFYLMRLGR